LFGSYSPEDDGEDTIVAILFPVEDKAVNYFIQFAKYQNRIRWDDCSLYKVVKDALSSHIHDELCFCHKDIFTFKGLKRVVLRVDSNYWKRTLEESNKFCTACSPQNSMPQVPRVEQKYPAPPASLFSFTNQMTQERTRSSLPWTLASHTEPSTSTSTNRLGPDGCLTLLE